MASPSIDAAAAVARSDCAASYSEAEEHEHGKDMEAEAGTNEDAVGAKVSPPRHSSIPHANIAFTHNSDVSSDSTTDIDAVVHKPKGFQELPNELKISIIQIVIKQPRYFKLTPAYNQPTHDDYMNSIPQHIREWTDTSPRATYVPMSKNYASTLEINKLARDEGLKNWEEIENTRTPVTCPRKVYINYDSDIMILTEGGVFTMRNFCRTV